MFDTFSSPIKTVLVMITIGLTWVWFFPWVAHVKKAGVSMTKFDAIRVIDTRLEMSGAITGDQKWSNWYYQKNYYWSSPHLGVWPNELQMSPLLSLYSRSLYWLWAKHETHHAEGLFNPNTMKFFFTDTPEHSENIFKIGCRNPFNQLFSKRDLNSENWQKLTDFHTLSVIFTFFRSRNTLETEKNQNIHFCQF
jgi:hypothetical protein